LCNRRLLLCLHTIFRALKYWAHRAVVLAIAWHLVTFKVWKHNTQPGGPSQTCQLSRAERVRPASEFQTRLTRTVDENPLETHIAINDEKFPFPPQQLYRWYRRRSCVLKQLILPINYCRKSSSRPDNHLSFANFLLVLGPPCTCHVLSLRHRYHDQELRHPAGGKYCSRFAFTI